MTRKKFQMPEAELRIAQRCYRQAKAPKEIVECLRMQRARISIWFDDELSAWIIQDGDGSLHKLPPERLHDLPFLLKQQHEAPGYISILSGDDTGATAARNKEELLAIEHNLTVAQENRKAGVYAPLNRAIKPKSEISEAEISEIFADLF